MGTIVNALAIVAAGILGLSLRKVVPASIEAVILPMVGIAVALIGLTGVLKSMMFVDPVTLALKDHDALLLFVGLVAGASLGEWWHLDERIAVFGKSIEARFRKDGFAAGFVSASLIFCIGAMAIIGSIQDGILHDPSILYVKAAIDFVTGMVLASTLGFGVIFSAIPVLIYQGSITMLSGWIAPWATEELIRQVCLLGYVIVMVIGLNFMGITKIKTANLLPALLLPLCWQFVLHLI